VASERPERLETASATDTAAATADDWPRPSVTATVPASDRSAEMHLVGFPPTDRFQALAPLGVGGNGTVYRALDRDRSAEVALKVLHHLSPDALLRFKQEFRSLQDIHHPNLVRMDELVEVAGTWFLTMELVDGPDFLGYVEARPGSRPRFDEARLRDALGQLAAGLDALHATGRVHRDVKPSNVRVSDGRLVVLDFGLVAELDVGGRARDAAPVGTAAYMAPEQARGADVGPAADWYAVGVMLYEAVTGRWPIEGHGIELVMKKLDVDPPALRELEPAVPADLDELCRALLDRQPARRLDGAAVLERLGRGDDRVRPRAASAGPSAMPFVGRAAERERLAGAVARAAGGELAVVVIEGESGLGKSALVHHLLATSDVVGLHGRCYERETVPYKAFDGVVDILTGHLAELPPGELERMLPAGADVLRRVFPVLAKLPIARAVPAIEPPREPVALREAAFGALRGLLTALARRRPLAIAVDDLQWADTESLELLDALFGPDRLAPPCLLVVTARPAAERGPEVEAALARLLARPGAEHLRLAPLSLAEGTELATCLLPAHSGALARRIARAAEGHPLFVDTLVRFGRDYESGEILDLDRALATRLDGLEPDERRVLELAALAGAPTAPAVLTRAAAQTPDDFERAVHALRNGRLVRTGVRDGAHTVEVLHDRIREVATARMPAAARADGHRALAVAMQAQDRFDPAQLVAHWREAGDAASAAHWAEQAADEAMTALAFHRAAALYRVGLELAPATAAAAEARRSLLVRLGDALAGAGRGGDAAAAYLRALDGADPTAGLELRRRAAQHLLQSGRFAEGRRVLGELLTAVDVAIPSTATGTIASLLWHRARLRVHGLRFTARDAADIPAATLTRVDTLWAAGASLAMLDTLRGADFQARGLRAALEVGEPGRIARALAQEAGFQSTSEPPPLHRTRQLLATARTLADRIGDPVLTGSCLLMQGVAEHCGLELSAARTTLLDAEQLLRTQCSNVSWELDTGQYFILFTLMYLAELRELATRAAGYAREARDRDDLYGWILVTAGVGYMAALVDDQPDAGEAEIEALMARWGQPGFLLPHWLALKARVELALYRGGDRAHRLLDTHARAVDRSMLLRARQVQVLRTSLRGRAALAARGAGDRALLAAAAADERALRQSPFYGARAWAHALAAGVRAAAGQRDAAVAELRQGIALAGGWRMDHLALAMRWILGGELGGDEGDELRRNAEARLRAEGVRAPARFARFLIPGFGGEEAP